VSTILALLVAVEPFGLTRTWPRRPLVAAIVAVVLSVAVVLADPVLDALDLAPESFWIAAGIVLLIPGTNRLLNARTNDVAGPAAVLVAMALATRDGSGITLVAVGVSALAVLALSRVTGRWTGVAERVAGALMIVVALDLIRDGVIAV
jgi:small neutral amino acid transporter SnatA (MarC family)